MFQQEWNSIPLSLVKMVVLICAVIAASAISILNFSLAIIMIFPFAIISLWKLPQKNERIFSVVCRYAFIGMLVWKTEQIRQQKSLEDWTPYIAQAIVMPLLLISFAFC